MYVLDYNGGEMTDVIGTFADRNRFLAPLRRQNGKERWALTMWPLPEGVDYEDAVDLPRTAYLQEAGAVDALTVEIRQGGVRWVVGHAPPVEALDVPITLPHSTLMVSATEVFDAEEAADLFLAYQQTGELPPGYSLRPVERYAE